MAIAAILTVAVSLSLVGTALLMRQAVNNELVQLNQNVDLQVFVQPTASAAEIATLRTTISQTPQIRKFVTSTTRRPTNWPAGSVARPSAACSTSRPPRRCSSAP